MTQTFTASHKPPLTAPLLGLLMATSSIVFIEPAPAKGNPLLVVALVLGVLVLVVLAYFLYMKFA